MLEKFAHASVIGIDNDPMLPALARKSSDRFGDRLQLVDADLLTARLAVFGGCARSDDRVDAGAALVATAAARRGVSAVPQIAEP